MEYQRRQIRLNCVSPVLYYIHTYILFPRYFSSDYPLNVCAIRFSSTLSSYDIGHHRLQGHLDGNKAIILPARIYLYYDQFKADLNVHRSY